MKILYAVQATGNGHISRAMELYPALSEIGTVDIFLSGNNNQLRLEAPVKYRSKGLSLYYNQKGGLDYWKILLGCHPLKLRKEIAELPVEKYDLVINDFEYLTAAACRARKIPSVNLGHQASFVSSCTPRPEKKNIIGEWILKNYARSTHYLGLHFLKYDDFILPPVIKKQILNAHPTNGNHITIYLPSFSQNSLLRMIHPIKDQQFEVFTKESTKIVQEKNITLFPVDRQLFNKSLVSCQALVTGAGFETPSEALYLGKKLLCIPVRGQYEQLCNAAALKRMGVKCIDNLNTGFADTLYHLLSNRNAIPRQDYGNSIPRIVERLVAFRNSTSIDRSAWDDAPVKWAY